MSLLLWEKWQNCYDAHCKVDRKLSLLLYIGLSTARDADGEPRNTPAGAVASKP